MLLSKSLSFTTNNVKGIQSSKKRLKLIQHLKDKVGLTEVKQKWKKDFKGQVFFSHGKTNSCSVLTAYFGK